MNVVAVRRQVEVDRHRERWARGRQEGGEVRKIYSPTTSFYKLRKHLTKQILEHTRTAHFQRHAIESCLYLSSRADRTPCASSAKASPVPLAATFLTSLTARAIKKQRVAQLNARPGGQNAGSWSGFFILFTSVTRHTAAHPCRPFRPVRSSTSDTSY